MRNNIIHMDIDAFYASVEELDNPKFIGKALVVGGLSDSSIVTIANYQARKYGIHSAMPIFMAKSLCPNLQIAPMRRKRYLEKSQEVFSIVKDYSKIIEKVSIDECYIDISKSLKEPMDIINSMKNRIKKETGLTISVGLSYNKFLAKLASDWNKPNGVKVISKEDIPNILLGLDIKKVHGLGHKSQERLRNIGINTIEDLMGLEEDFLCELFGKMGSEIFNRIRGIDNRKVSPNRIRKSLEVERTFDATRDTKILKSYLEDYSLELENDLKNKNIGFKTLSLKFKSWDFVISSHSKTYYNTLTEYKEILDRAIFLFEENYKVEKLRLMGLSASNLVDLDKIQLSFYDI
ncbi:MAG: DNA polymerase IV [Peptoniphilaceae bacterium]